MAFASQSPCWRFFWQGLSILKILLYYRIILNVSEVKDMDLELFRKEIAVDMMMVKTPSNLARLIREVAGMNIPNRYKWPVRDVLANAIARLSFRYRSAYKPAQLTAAYTKLF